MLAFARLRELLGGHSHSIDIPADGSARDVWHALERRSPGVMHLADSTRLARNGRVAALDERLAEGDEVALLPPVGGG